MPSSTFLLVVPTSERKKSKINNKRKPLFSKHFGTVFLELKSSLTFQACSHIRTHMHICTYVRVCMYVRIMLKFYGTYALNSLHFIVRIIIIISNNIIAAIITSNNNKTLEIIKK